MKLGNGAVDLLFMSITIEDGIIKVLQKIVRNYCFLCFSPEKLYF
jgi:hypothetical protein